MTDYIKCGNRYYKLENDEVVKATYNEEENKYNVCGQWTAEYFEANNEGYDENTNIEYCNICEALSLNGLGCSA